VLADGEARVDLDPRYVAAVTGKYQVQLTSYGAAVLWVAERKRDHFVVRTVPCRAPGPRAARGSAGVSPRAAATSRRHALRRWICPMVELAAPVPTRADARPMHVVSGRIDVAARTESALGEPLATPKTIQRPRPSKK
jgi:hypothetical protein